MPKTKFQKIIFGLLMSVVMAFGMETYNCTIKMGGLSYKVFPIVLKETAFMFIIVFIVSILFGNKIGQRIAFKNVDIKKDNPLFVTIIVSSCTVLIMCPVMSFIATIIFTGIDKNFLTNWIFCIGKNFPMAIIWQLFFAGPFVRKIFNILFNYC